MADELQELILTDAAGWRTWLAEHHESSPGVWLVLAKKGTVAPTSLSYQQALPAGVTEVERAKADGRWDSAYAGPASIEVPADLGAALAAEPRAEAMFDILTSQNRYAVLYRINNAKSLGTRARRIDQFVAMLARGETVYPQKRTLSD
jgi:uncharacterized protein YdeI (YjbR/CyaY-like superfamily)